MDPLDIKFAIQNLGLVLHTENGGQPPSRLLGGGDLFGPTPFGGNSPNVKRNPLIQPPADNSLGKGGVGFCIPTCGRSQFNQAISPQLTGLIRLSNKHLSVVGSSLAAASGSHHLLNTQQIDDGI